WIRLVGLLWATHSARLACDAFFVSSRRRHTRLVSDWSSDVCSSDLRPPGRGRGGRSVVFVPGGEDPRPLGGDRDGELEVGGKRRSVERRGGEQGRTGWWRSGSVTKVIRAECWPRGRMRGGSRRGYDL